MLQAGIEKVKSLLGGKTVYVVSSIILVVLGLTYFYINNFGKKLSEEPNYSPETRLADIEEHVTGIVVDVSGAVNQPGLYKLDDGARVGEAIALAGGISSDASVVYVSKIINLAEKLGDTDKVYIPFEIEIENGEGYMLSPLVLNSQLISNSGPGQVPTQHIPTSSSSTNTPVSPSNSGAGMNVNTSSLEALDTLSGIGPAYAQRIVDNRPYKDFTELVSKSGIPKSTLDKIKTLISF